MEGWFYYKKGQFEKAAEHIYQTAAREARPDAEILGHLGDVTCRLGRLEEARRHWQEPVAELKRRLPMTKDMEEDKVRLEDKLQRLDEKQQVSVAELFD